MPNAYDVVWHAVIFMHCFYSIGALHKMTYLPWIIHVCRCLL